MARRGPVGETEERSILEALGAGRSIRDIASEFNRSHSTISRVAKRNGFNVADRSETKSAAVCKSNYATDARIKLLGRGMDKATSMLPQIESPRDLKDWSVAVAVMMDKRRLEESTDPAGRGGEIRSLFEKMDEEAGHEL